MPIEFRCPSCSKLLRTPDESAGKKAKCPQCGGIADVPLASNVSPTSSAVPQGSDEPFAPLPPVMPTSPGSGFPAAKPLSSPFDAAATNPYASPAPVASSLTAQVSRGGLTPNRISFDKIFESVWTVYRPNLQQMVILGFVMFGVTIVLQIIGQSGNIATRTEPAINVVFTACNTIFGMVVQTWFAIGSILYMLKIARNEGASINDFGRAGPYFLRALLAQLVVGLVSFGILLVCEAPAIYLYFVSGQQQQGIVAAILGFLVAFGPMMYFFYRWLLTMYLIVDRELGVMDALSESSRFMAGNKLITFLILLVAGVVGGLFLIVTCFCIGYVFLIPYMSLLTTAIYLTATGQPWGPSMRQQMG